MHRRTMPRGTGARPRTTLLFCGGALATALALAATPSRAQADCGAAMPDFQSALQANSVEALQSFLDQHAPCFEGPARARVQALGGARTPEPEQERAALPSASPETAEQPVSEPAPPAADYSCHSLTSVRSLNSEVSVDVQFNNESGAPLTVAWIDYDGERQIYGVLPKDHAFVQQTFLTHPWEFSGPDGACIAIIQPDGETLEYVIGN